MSSTTSIDTNILILLWLEDPEWNLRASSAVRAAAGLGQLVVCGPVFSELMGLPGRDSLQLEDVIAKSGFNLEWILDEDVWRVAGDAFQGYVKRKKRSGGSLPRRVMTDLLIGAHALVRGHALLTMDQDIYRRAFPDLRLYAV